MRDAKYRYEESLKSPLSDELVNTCLLRPVAGQITRILYPTRITPNGVTAASLLAGLAAAALYATGYSLPLAGLLVTLKDLLDSADGQLARARGESSRKGRFLDSVGDILVDLLVFGAIGWYLVRATGSLWMMLLAAAGLSGMTLRVSYHVYCHSAYLHLEDRYSLNRLREEFTAGDASEDAVTCLLHKLYLFFYGWQDRLMESIDGWCAGKELSQREKSEWYGDTIALRFSGLIGFGTEFLLLTLCSLFGKLELYIYLNLFVMNGIAAAAILYRRFVLRNRILGTTHKSNGTAD